MHDSIKTSQDPSLPQAVLTDAESMIATLKSQVRIGRARWHANKQQSNVIEVTFADADAIIAALSRMGGESVPAEATAAKDEFPRPCLCDDGYCCGNASQRGTGIHSKGTHCKAFRLAAPTAPAQQAAPSMWTGSRAGVESYGALEHEDRFDAEQAADVQGEPDDAAQRNGLAWAVSKWRDEVSQRPMVNVHRRSLDDTWRQVIRYFGGDPDKLVGPSHDAIYAANGNKL